MTNTMSEDIAHVELSELLESTHYAGNVRRQIEGKKETVRERKREGGRERQKDRGAGRDRDRRKKEAKKS